MIALAVLGGIVLVLGWIVFHFAIYGVRIYNNFVSLSNNIKKNGADIQLLMKQRHDELPKLVSCCERYMGHENGTLKDVMAARAGIQKASNPSQVASAESTLHAAIGAVFATVENYPNLKADEQVNELMERVTSLEDQIASSRDSYNASANIYNIRVGQFPDKIIAGRYGFKPADMLSFTEGETSDVKLFDKAS
jgi:LemA protein